MPLFLLFIENYKFASVLSFLCIGVTTFAAMSVYHKEKLIDWTLVKYLGLPLVAMVFLTGFMLKAVSLLWVKFILGLTLVLAGSLMIFAKQNVSSPKALAEGYRYAPVFLSPVALVIGAFSGMSGVAGGVFEIPLMTAVLRVPAHKAVATSSAIVFLASVLGLAGRIVANHQNIDIQPDLLFYILLCAFGGGRIGPKISLKVSRQKFKKICGVFVFMIGIYYILQFFS